MSSNPTLCITVMGTPAPQGSKRHVGRGIMVESSKRVKPWREDVKQAALDVITVPSEAYGRPGVTFAPGYPLTCPVVVEIVFRLTRPKSHWRTGRNAGLLRDAAPREPAGKPDLDKLVRSTLDALGTREAGVWLDDAQVVELSAIKCYATSTPPGALIRIWRIGEAVTA